MAAGARLCIGVIVGAHGIKGAVRLKSYTTDPADVQSYGPVEDESGQRRFSLSVIGEAKGVVTVRIPGVTDRNAAEALKGTRLYVARDVLPEPEEDEFYYSDLAGLKATLEDGTPFGTVKAVFDAGAGDILEIARPEGESVLLPFTRRVVPVVDIAGGRVVIDPPIESDSEEEGPDPMEPGNE